MPYPFPRRLELSALVGLVAVAGVVAHSATSTTRAQDREDPSALARRYFAIADYDGGGWISISEAGSALLASREVFFQYDLDRDGGIDLPEFEARVRAIIARDGFYQPPIPAPRRNAVLPAPTRVWFDRFDLDRNGSWDLAELSSAFAERNIQDLLDEDLWKKFDVDGSNRVESHEIENVMKFVLAALPLAGGTATTLRELFGTPLPIERGPGVVPGPPRLPGPLPLFERLDVDGDGACDGRDLAALSFPAALPIRPETLLTALDSNGDGKLDRDELARALGTQ